MRLRRCSVLLKEFRDCCLHEYPLIRRPAKGKARIREFLDKRSIDECIDIGQYLSLSLVELVSGVTCPKPNVFIGAFAFDSGDEF